MSLPPLNLINILLAAAPILVVLYLMIALHWSGSKAGPAGWLVSVLVAVLFFGAGGNLLLVAWAKAVLLAWFVLYIIWMALFLYHTVNEAGVITVIGEELPGLAQDRPAQALLIAWLFGSFLQGATGFGVPAAIVAPLLLGMGFAANTAVTIALLGHAWSVTFGSLGSSFVSLIAATGLPGEILAGPTAALLAICCLGCGVGVLWLVGGLAAVRQRGLFMLILTLVMGSAQWGIARLGLWTLAAFGAGLIGLLVAILYFLRTNQEDRPFDYRRLLQAFMPYLLLIMIIVLGELVLHDVLGVVQINPVFPEVVTRFGWLTAAGTGRSINLFGHAGALLLYTSLITLGWYLWRSTRSSAPPSALLRACPESGEGTSLLPCPPATYSGRLILQKTLKGSISPTIAIYALVAMALTMQHAGMTQLLAEALSRSGTLFPFLSPFIGALGAFMTGSNTNSNVVFGQLQQQTAATLQLAVPLILAAQTAGGALGGTFAPAKVIVGCSTVTGADDGYVLKLATLYSFIILAVIGVVVWLAV
jgi:lactate permease